YKMNCLVDQEYIKDEDINVAQYIEQTGKALGAELSIVRFTRFGLGEGIEKKVDDFAEEVRKQAGL
ncbi:MAG: elongation factor Ts, partial [Saccharofermentans sp.]|nr:elongation factor Ts [Saccharofermentans sp.]